MDEKPHKNKGVGAKMVKYVSDAIDEVSDFLSSDSPRSNKSKEIKKLAAEIEQQQFATALTASKLTDAQQKEFDKHLEEALYQSQIDERKRQEKQAEEERRKKIIKTKLQVQQKLKKIIPNEASDGMLYAKIILQLDEFETETQTSIFETQRFRLTIDDTPDERSMLIIEIIKLFESDPELSLKEILVYFKKHAIYIKNECSRIQKVCKYDPERHKVDPVSEFRHHAMDGKYVCVDIKGDGNCLWNSISVSLFGDMSHMASLRLLTAYTLEQYRAEFEDYIAKQESKYGYKHELTFDELVRASVDLNVWGDELHVLALSLALQRPVYSYGSFINLINDFIVTYDDLKNAYEHDTFPNHFKHLANADDADKEPILLYYNGESHYSVVLPVQENIEPLVPKSEILKPLFGGNKDDFLKKDNDEKQQPSTSHESSNKKTKSNTKVNKSTLQTKREQPVCNSNASSSAIDAQKVEKEDLTSRVKALEKVSKERTEECVALQEQLRGLLSNYNKIANERDEYKHEYQELKYRVKVLEDISTEKTIECCSLEHELQDLKLQYKTVLNERDRYRQMYETMNNS